MKTVTIVTPCYNEEANVRELYTRIKAVFDGQYKDKYRYEHLFIDNASTDKTVSVIRELAREDSRVKAIVNMRNFGHIRSPFYALMQAQGDAVMLMVSDLQDPPELIPQFIEKWEQGFKVTMGVKSGAEESALMFFIRRSYYKFINRLSNVRLIKDTTGFGLYDKEVIDWVRKINDPYPYFRGMVSDLGYDIAQIPYKQPARKRGITKNNFYTLYDMAMLGITSFSKIPLRVATMAGFAMSAVSLLIAVGYLIAKLVLWNTFSMGMAPVVIGVFFFSSVQLFFIGIIGEYIGWIHTQVLKRPMVIERERIGF